jgi:hypothetical protein
MDRDLSLAALAALARAGGALTPGANRIDLSDAIDLTGDDVSPCLCPRGRRFADRFMPDSLHACCTPAGLAREAAQLPSRPELCSRQLPCSANPPGNSNPELPSWAQPCGGPLAPALGQLRPEGGLRGGRG